MHVVLHACVHVPTTVRECTGTPRYTHTDKHACLTRHANTHRHMCVDTHIPPPRPGGGAFSPCVRPLQRDSEPRRAQQAHPSARSEHGSSCPSVTPDKGPVHVKAPPLGYLTAYTRCQTGTEYVFEAGTESGVACRRAAGRRGLPQPVTLPQRLSPTAARA